MEARPHGRGARVEGARRRGRSAGPVRWWSARKRAGGPQIALSLGLLTAAGLFAKGRAQSWSSRPGLPAGSATGGTGGQHAWPATTKPRGARCIGVSWSGSRAVPGVSSSQHGFGGGVWRLHRRQDGAEGRYAARFGKDGRRVASRRFTTSSERLLPDFLGLPVLRGRGFTPAEEQDFICSRRCDHRRTTGAGTLPRAGSVGTADPTPGAGGCRPDDRQRHRAQRSGPDP